MPAISAAPVLVLAWPVSNASMAVRVFFETGRILGLSGLDRAFMGACPSACGGAVLAYPSPKYCHIGPNAAQDGVFPNIFLTFWHMFPIDFSVTRWHIHVVSGRWGRRE